MIVANVGRCAENDLRARIRHVLTSNSTRRARMTKRAAAGVPGASGARVDLFGRGERAHPRHRPCAAGVTEKMGDGAGTQRAADRSRSRRHDVFQVSSAPPRAIVVLGAGVPRSQEPIVDLSCLWPRW